MAIASDSIGWENLSQTLEQRKALGHPWILYHEPHSISSELLLPSSSSVLCLSDWGEIPEGEGYLIAPFTVGEIYPIVFVSLSADHQRHRLDFSKRAIMSGNSKNCPTSSSAPSDSYQATFCTFIEALAAGTFDKLVLARSQDVLLSSPLNPVQAFLQATQLYPSAYTYLLYTPQTGIWLGSTPELLLSTEGEYFATMALAGTQPAPPEGREPLWSTQHKREQSYVTRYISDTLTALGIEISLSSTYTARAGSLAHLRTDITGQLSEHLSISQLLEALHPTPAVCGLPKAEAWSFIQEHEAQARAYYSGCLGLIHPKGESRIYVNLRCAQLLSPRLVRLYAGGGLISGSRLEDEWCETERKMQTMRSLFPQN